MLGGALRVATVALATLSCASAFSSPAALATRTLLSTPTAQVWVCRTTQQKESLLFHLNPPPGMLSLHGQRSV